MKYGVVNEWRVARVERVARLNDDANANVVRIIKKKTKTKAEKDMKSVPKKRQNHLWFSTLIVELEKKKNENQIPKNKIKKKRITQHLDRSLVNFLLKFPSNPIFNDSFS